MKKIIFGILLLFFSLGLKGQNFLFLTSPNSGPVMDSINVKFDSLTSESITGGGWVSLKGNIQTALGDTIGVTGGIHSSIRVTALNTSGQWGITYPQSGTVLPGGGVASTTAFVGSSAAMNNCWINSDIEYQYTPQPQVQVSGLLPGHTYSIQVSGTISAATMTTIAPVTDSANSWYFAGSTLTSIQGPGVVVAFNPATSTPNSSSSYTFTALTADSAGKLYLWVGQYQDGGVGVVSAFKLKQTD